MNTHMYTHTAENASQICTNGDIRLSQGSTDYQGNVQVCFNGNWGSVCHDGWDYRDAQTVCNILGYNDGYAVATRFRYFGVQDGPIFLDEVDCAGNETSILDCLIEDPGNHACIHIQDAGVICSGTFLYVCTHLHMHVHGCACTMMFKDMLNM